MLAFSCPCDNEHVSTTAGDILKCVRSRIVIGRIKNGIYFVDRLQVEFLDADRSWPLRSQPSNYWGTEGQFVAWNSNEMAQKPLSY
jgi:hypothetical protein